jgi:membrane-bound ClpP family serine protease
VDESHRTPLSTTQVARGLFVLGRLVRVATGIVAAVIVIGVLLVVLEANPRHEIVATVNGIASDLVGPFKRLFTLDSGKLQVLVNWGIAAGVYLVIGVLFAALPRKGRALIAWPRSTDRK